MKEKLTNEDYRHIAEVLLSMGTNINELPRTTETAGAISLPAVLDGKLVAVDLEQLLAALKAATTEAQSATSAALKAKVDTVAATAEASNAAEGANAVISEHAAVALRALMGATALFDDIIEDVTIQAANPSSETGGSVVYVRAKKQFAFKLLQGAVTTYYANWSNDVLYHEHDSYAIAKDKIYVDSTALYVWNEQLQDIKKVSSEAVVQLVQTITGDADKAPSAAAVFKALQGVQADIDAANGKADGLETRVTKLEEGGGIVPDTTVIEGSPNAVSGGAVYNELTTMRGRTYNMLDVSTSVKDEKLSTNNGEFRPGGTPGTDTSDFISVESGKTYTLQAAGKEHIANWFFYDNGGKYIGKDGGWKVSVSEVIIPSGVFLLKVSYTSESKEYMITEGKGIKPYKPYWGNIKVHASDIINDVPFKKQYIDDFAIAPTNYAFAGHPIEINIPQLLPLPWSECFYMCVSGRKGKLLDKRYTYTPTTAETIDFKSMLYDKQYDLLNQATSQIIVRDTSTVNELTVLVLGDSTVNHGYETKEMLELAQGDRFNLTLLGTRNSAPDAAIEGNHHEGRGGWTIADYINKAFRDSSGQHRVDNAFFNPVTKTFDFSYYMQQQGYSKVDMVFIQLGINDVVGVRYENDRIWNGQVFDVGIQNTAKNFIADMHKIIDSIKAFNPNCKIVINLTIPCNDSQDVMGNGELAMTAVWQAKRNVYVLNRKIIEEFAATTNGENNVFVSWYNLAINSDSDMKDWVHPSFEGGYPKLGEQMYSFMRAIC